MVKIVVVLFCFVFSGCTSIEESRLTKTYFDGRNAISRIDIIQIGMKYKEVASIMGDHMNIGYQQSHGLLGAVETITLKNPYRAEIFSAQDQKVRLTDIDSDGSRRGTGNGGLVCLLNLFQHLMQKPHPPL